MAIIGKIRENSVLVLIIVGVSLLLFILGDLLGNQGGSGADNVIGTAYGKPIDAVEYERRVKEMTDQENMNRAMQGRPEMNESETDQVRETVWNQMVGEIISDRELAHFPLSVSQAELNDMVHGENIHPSILQEPGFTGIDGRFSRDSLIRYLNSLEAPNDQAREAKRRWKQFEQSMKKERVNIKYSTLLTKGVYVTNAEAKRDYEENNRIYKIRFAVKKYFDVSDSLITVTDDDIRAYYEKHKFRKQYEQAGSREYQYVQFPLVPSDEDKQNISKELEELIADFKASTNDSAFVMTHSDNKYFADRFSASNEFSPAADSLIQAADSGDVIGPYEEFGFMRITKIRGIKTEPEVRVRHILLGTQKGDMKTLNKRADSLRNVIRRNNNFEAMVSAFSDDPGSLNTGGVYEWFTEGVMVKPFNDACFNGKVGDMPIVETEFGVHLIEILGKRDAKRIKYATVDLKIVPGPATEEAARAKAIAFLDAMPDATKFDSIAQLQKLVLLKNEILSQQKTIDQDERSRELVRFVQTGMEGDVSDVINYGDYIVVAHIMAVKEKGVPEFEDVKEIMTIPTRQEKKAELLKKQMSGAKSVEEVALKTGTTVLEADVTFGSPTIRGGGGNEYEVVGTIFSLSAANKGSMTVPIQGKVGVYVVQLVDIIEPQPNDNLGSARKSLNDAKRNRAGGDAFNALKKNANIEDKRQMF